jgi:DGQHR domain-containing protein
MNGNSGQTNGSIDIKVLEVAQPLGTFYVGVMKANDLRKIAAADTRRQEQREVEIYTGIQRELSKKRQAEIKDYISTFDAAFPNSFIIAIKAEDVLSQDGGVLRIRSHEKAASIIDGQHRLAGFTEFNSDNFELIVSIFIDLPIEDQAMLFATINLKQTKVSPSLVYDLFEETKLRSPQKSCHNICKAMNTDMESPFFHRIKPLGKKTDDYTGILTQATFVKRLLPHVSNNPDKIRDNIKRKISLDVNDPDNADCVFWRYFVEEKDWAILKIVMNYFNAVKDQFADDWNSEQSPLPRSIGFSALMKLLPALFRKGQAHKTFERSFFVSEFKKAKPLAPFTFDEYPASGVGENKLYQALAHKILQPAD